MEKKKRTRSQIGRNNKAKGSSFERQVAKKLTNWWGGDGDFHRTPASGALHWKDDKRVSGDIVPPENSTFPFSVECKNYDDVTLYQLITNTGKFPKFWSQCTSDAAEFKKVPMLVFKRTRLKPWVVVPYCDELIWAASMKKYPAFVSFFYEMNPSTVIGIQLDSLLNIDKEDVLSWYGKKNW